MSIGHPGPARTESLGILQGVMKWLQDQRVTLRSGPMVSASFTGGDIHSARKRGAKMRLRMQRPWVDGPKRR